MKDVSKTKDQLMDELDGMRRRFAELERSTSKDRAKEDGKHIRNLAFLSRTATGFLELSPEDNIHEFIAEQLKELAGNSIVIVNSFEEATDSVCCRAVLGFGEKMGTVVSILGKHPVEMVLKIDNEARLGLTSRKLVKIPGGFYEFSFRRIPRTVCRAIEKLLDLGGIYAMGFAWKGNLFGNASILTRKGTELADPRVIETFIYQASVALQRRRVEQALQEAHDELEIGVEERTRELVEANAQLHGEVVERKRAEEMLRESERKYRTIFETTGAATVIIEEDTTISLANAEFEKLSGYSKEEIEGKKSWIEFVARHDLERLKEYHHLRRIDPDAAPKEYEFQFIDKKGSVKDVLLSVDAISETKKSVASLLDITERKQAEETLKKSEEKLKTILENTRDMIFQLSPLGIIQYVSPKVEGIYGYKPEDLIGKHLKKTTPVSELLKASKVLKSILSGKIINNFEINQLDAKGKIVPMEISATPVIKDGKVIIVQGIMRDITDRKRAEEALRESEIKFRSVAQSANDAIISADSFGNITFWNKAAQKMFGYTEEEVLGQPLTLLMPERYRDAYRSEMERFRSTGESYLVGKTVELSGLRKDGSEFPFELSLASWEVGGEAFYTSIIRDLTERKKMEEQLILTDRLASIGELASGIAHELNNPLTSVIGFSDLLLDQDVSDDVKEDLKVINREAQRTAGIVGNLLTFARKHPPAKHPLDINNIIKMVLELRAYEQKVNNILVNTRFASDLPEIMVDNFQLQQVFLNIVINAEHFMIEAHRRGNLTITTERVDGIIRTSFADDGPGIAKGNLGHLFDPFFTTKEVGKGTGLGLSICHGIIAEHGGKIYAESKLGKGATFIVELPVSQ